MTFLKMKFSKLMCSIFLIANICFFNGAECIQGGELIEIEDFVDHFSYTVGLKIGVVKDNIKLVNTCTGGIIGDDMILTAAHCFVPDGYTQPPEYTGTIIRANTTLNRESVVTGSIERIARRVFIPESYMAGTEESKIYDIAIVQLNSGLNTRRYNLKTLKLPNPNINIGQYETKAVTGFGLYEPNRPGDDRLRTLDIEVVDDGPLRYLRNYLIEGRPQDNLGRRGFCSGDSGGPLVTDPRNPVVIGIVKANNECDDVSQPGVYVRVTYYLNRFIRPILNSRGNINDNTIRVLTFESDGCRIM